MIKYYNLENIAITQGFVTNEDQEINNMTFSIIGDIIKVACDIENTIDSWASNHSLIEVDSVTAEAYIADFEAQPLLDI